MMESMMENPMSQGIPSKAHQNGTPTLKLRTRDDVVMSDTSSRVYVLKPSSEDNSNAGVPPSGSWDSMEMDIQDWYREHNLNLNQGENPDSSRVGEKSQSIVCRNPTVSSDDDRKAQNTTCKQQHILDSKQSSPDDNQLSQGPSTIVDTPRTSHSRSPQLNSAGKHRCYDWIVGQGEMHSCRDREAFTTYWPIPAELQPLRSHGVVISGIGTVVLEVSKSPLGKQCEKLVLKHVLHAPHLPCNFISREAWDGHYRSGDSIGVGFDTTSRPVFYTKRFLENYERLVLFHEDKGTSCPSMLRALGSSLCKLPRISLSDGEQAVLAPLMLRPPASPFNSANPTSLAYSVGLGHVAQQHAALASTGDCIRVELQEEQNAKDIFLAENRACLTFQRDMLGHIEPVDFDTLSLHKLVKLKAEYQTKYEALMDIDADHPACKNDMSMASDDEDISDCHLDSEIDDLEEALMRSLNEKLRAGARNPFGWQSTSDSDEVLRETPKVKDAKASKIPGLDSARLPSEFEVRGAREETPWTKTVQQNSSYYKFGESGRGEAKVKPEIERNTPRTSGYLGLRKRELELELTKVQAEYETEAKKGTEMKMRAERQTSGGARAEASNTMRQDLHTDQLQEQNRTVQRLELELKQQKAKMHLTEQRAAASNKLRKEAEGVMGPQDEWEQENIARLREWERRRGRTLETDMAQFGEITQEMKKRKAEAYLPLRHRSPDKRRRS